MKYSDRLNVFDRRESEITNGSTCRRENHRDRYRAPPSSYVGCCRGGAVAGMRSLR